MASAVLERSIRPLGEILRANILTRFNFILGTLLVVVLAVGPLQDAVFGIILVANALIGIGQELRAKMTLDRLAVLTAPLVRVIRDATSHEIKVADLVTGDLVELRPGDQLVADGVVRTSASLQVDESLLTGESEPVDKQPGDRLLSGSFVVAGSGDLSDHRGKGPRRMPGNWRPRQSGSRWCDRSWLRASTRFCGMSPGR